MKFALTLISGKEIDIDERTYNTLTKRLEVGKINGFYKINSGPSSGTNINIPNMIALEVIMSDKERKAMEKAEAVKKAALMAQIKNNQSQSPNNTQTVKGSFEHTPKTCPCDHGGVGKDKDPNVVVRMIHTQAGTKQYFPTCTLCGWRGTIVKPASLLNAYGIEPEAVELYKG